MKEIVVISGKGGTGKTSITASLAMLAGKEVVVADCDVDASNLHLLLDPAEKSESDFYSGYMAKINPDKCTACEICIDTCRFNAINLVDGKATISQLDCEGCGYCARVCPENAIRMEENLTGKWYSSESKNGSRMIHAKLDIGAENSGKMVAMVKNKARKYAKENNLEYILIDGAPGIGCPVISSLSGASYAILVTEPTKSGLHDLKRVFQLAGKFKIKTGCIINKADLNTEMTNEILTFLKGEKIPLIATIPYDHHFTTAMIAGKTIIEYNHTELSDILTGIWNKVKLLIKQS